MEILNTKRIDAETKLMAKRAAKVQTSKGKAPVKASSSKGVKQAVASKTRPRVKAGSAAVPKSRAVAASPLSKRGADTTPPSTDIRRAYKSRLLAGYIGAHGAHSIPSSKK